MNKTTSSRRKRWFFARSMARAYQEWLEKRTGSGSRGRSKSVKAKQRPMFAEALEPRVLFSATPAPAEEVPAEEQQEAATAHASGELDSVIEGMEEFSFDEGIEVDFSEEDLERLAAEAVARWEESGLTEEQLEALENITYVVSDLEGLEIGAAEGNSVYIDYNAAGADWFVDDTEWLDEEFVEIDGLLRAASGGSIDGLAEDGIDLLSVLMHEQGHILGLLDEYELGLRGTVMHGAFEEGERRLPVDGQADGFVASSLEGRHSADITVTNFLDDDGSSGTPSLRDAINQSASGDTITLNAGTYVISKSGSENSNVSGDFDIGSRDITIVGAGKDVTFIDAQTIDRIFHLNSGSGKLTLKNMTLINGRVEEGDGGAIYVTTGAELVLEDVKFQDNEVLDTIDNNTSARGGAIYAVNRATVDGTNVDFIDNKATRTAGNESAQGGGFYANTLSVVNLTGGTFSGNDAREGGGFVATAESQVTLNGVTFTGNTANDGAGFYVSTNAKVTGTGVTLDSNVANTRGGGFRNASFTAEVTLIDSTISNNTATEEHGGGFYNNGITVLDNTDVTNNHTLDLSATNRRDGYGGGFYNAAGSVTLQNGSDIRDNDAYGYGGGFANNGGTVTMSDGEIDGNSTIYFNSSRHGGGFSNQGDGTANLTNVTISDNFTGSDTGGTRLRGAGGGFYNSDGSVVNIDGTSSLIRNQAEDGGAFYNTSTGGEVNITGTAAVRIVIGGSEANANFARVRGGAFRSTGNTAVNLDYVDITYNDVSEQRGGAFYADGSSITGNHVKINHNETGLSGRTGDEQGGGFWASSGAVVTLTDSEVNQNSAVTNGGGIYSTTATVNLISSEVDENYTQNSGGGIFNEGSSILNLTDTSVSDNIARDHGGGVYSNSDSQANVLRSQISRNLAGYESDGVTRLAADKRGGGIWLSNRAQVSVIDSEIEDNEAARYGGGINSENEVSLTISGSTVSGNVSDNHGAGIRFASNTNLNMTNSTVSGNYAGFSRANNGGVETLVQDGRVAGGIWSQSNGATSVFNHVTITDNNSTASTGAGLYRSDNGSVTVENSIIFGNHGDAETGTPNSTADTQGQMTLVGANIIGGHAGSGLIGDTGGRSTVDPGLGALADNGGVTLSDGSSPLTHTITSGGSAEDTAVNTSISTDQLGNGRDVAAADLGSFELVPVATSISLDEFTVPGTALSGETATVSALASSTGAGPVSYAWSITDPAGNPVAGGPFTGPSVDFSYLTAVDDPVQAINVSVVATDGTTGQVIGSVTEQVTFVDPAACPEATSAGVVGTATVTTAADGGAGSLREAIDQANASAAGTFVIQFAAGINPTLSLAASGNENANANGDLDISKTNGAVSIIGDGTTVIDGGGVDRVFDIRPGAVVFLSNLDITGGETTITGSSNEHGGGIRNLGGIVIMKEVDIIANKAASGTDAGQGGGIYSTSSGTSVGMIFMTGGSVSNNEAESNGGGISFNGTNAGESFLYLDGTTIGGNTAASNDPDNNLDDRRGGGLYISDDGNRIVLNNVIVSDNQTAGDERNDGGGIAVNGADNILEMTGGSIIRNIAGGNLERDSDGGGFWVGGVRNTVTMDEVAIGGELSTGAGAAGIGGARVDGNFSNDDGGGFYVEGQYNTVNIIDSAIVGNVSTDNGAGFFNASDNSTLNLIQTKPDALQIRNNYTDSTNGYGAGFWNSGVVNITGSPTDPIEIKWNEARGTTNNQDVRGGGFWNSDGVANLTDVRIEENEANRHGAGFWNSGGGIVNIDSSDPAVFKSTVSNNKTHDTNDGNGGGFYTTTNGSQVNLTDVVVDGNTTTNDGAGFYQSGNGSIVNLVRTDITNNVSQDDGAGFHNASDGSIVTLDTVLIDGNTSETQHGGGFRNEGIITGSDVQITNNTTLGTGDSNRVGAGFHNNGAESSVTLTRAVIANNNAYGRGGGIYNSDGAVTLTDFVLSNNTTDQGTNESQGRAGGLWNSDRGSVNLTDGEVSSNTSFGHGGGVFQQSDGSVFNATNVTFSDNLAGWDVSDNAFEDNRVGGAIWATSQGTVALNHVTITNNKTTRNGNDSGSGIRVDSGGNNVTIENSIIFGNLRNVDATAVANDTDSHIGTGSLELIGNNIIGSHSGNSLGGNTAGRITDDPNLGALTDNGGFSKTHAVDSASNATDAALVSTVTLDQRGAVRDAVSDIGAFEVATIVYVDDDWAGTAPNVSVADGDLGASNEQPAVFGVSAFATIAEALAAVSSGGAIIINGGDYSGESVTLADNKTIEITGPDLAATVSIGTLNGGSTESIIIEGGSTLSFGAGTISSDISGTGSLVKTGAGTLTLSNANTYSGTTTVSGGSLLINGDNSGATGAITVEAGAILGGTGSVGGNVSVESGGDLQPGVGSEGTLTIDSDLSIAGEYDFDISGTTVSTHDLASVTGNVTLSGALNIVEAGGTDFSGLNSGDEITVINLTGAGSVSGNFAGLGEGAAVTIGGSVFTISYTGGTGNDVVLDFVGEVETSVTIAGGVLVITDTNGAGDTDDRLKLTISATGYTLTETTGTNPIGSGVDGSVQNNAYEVFIPFSSLGGVTEIDINTLDGVDVVTIDFAGLAGTALQQKLVFDGGDGSGDTLAFENVNFATVTHTMIDPSSGEINLDGDAAIEVEYSGLEPVLINSGTVTDFVFNLPAGTADSATLSEAGGMLTLDGATFESTTFAAPSGSLTINGQAGDILTVSTAINLSAANTDLTLNVPSIDLRGNINSGTGDQTFGGDLSLENSTTDVELTAGNVNFNGDTTLKNSDGNGFYLTVSGAATNTAGNHFDLNDGRMQLRGGTEFINNGTFETGENGQAPIWADSQTNFDNKITNNGTFTANGSQFRLYVTLTNTATGTLVINNTGGAGAAELQMKAPQGIGTGGKIVNEGVLNISGTSTIFNDSGSIENANGGIVNVTSNVQFKDSSSLVNQSGGTVNLNSGDLTFDQTTATNNSGGILNLVDGSLSMINGGSVTSAGTTNLIDTDYLIEGTGTFTNAVGGVFDLSPDAVVRGITLDTILANNGTINFSQGGHFIFDGTGSIENAGLFDHVKGSGNDNVHFNGFDFNNLAGGIYRFHGGGDIEISGNGVFNNAGLLERTATAANDSVIFDFGTGANGSFNNLAGGIVQSLGGILHIAAQKGNTADAGSSWIANGGDLRIGGTWEGTLNGSSANGGRVEVTNTSNGEFFENLTVGAAGFTINVTGDGFLWDDSNINTQGNSLINTGIMDISGSAAKTVTGELTNTGTLNIIGDVTMTNGDIVNASGGTLDYVSGTVVSTNAGDEVINESGGTLTITGSGTKTLQGTIVNQGDADILGDLTITGGEITNESGGDLDFQSGTVTLTGVTDVIRNEAGGSFQFSTASTSSIGGDGSLINDAGGTGSWADGAISIGTNATIQNDGIFNFDSTSNESLFGAGEFINNGEFHHLGSNTNSDNIVGSNAGTFTNNGLFAFDSRGDFQLRPGYVFTNTATGIVRKTADNNSDPAQFFDNNGGAAGTVNNDGTFEVQVGTLKVTTSRTGGFDDVILPRIVGTELTGGTWIATQTGANNAVIDLESGEPGGITGIGANAVVTLTGANASLVQLTNFLDQIDGLLTLNGSQNLDAANDVTVGSTGTLQGEGGTLTGNLTVDADGTITPGVGAGDVDTLNVIGNLTLNGDYEVDIDGANGDLIDVNGAVVVGGNLEINVVNDPTAALITLIDNDGTADATTGAFTSLNGIATALADGATVTLGTKTYKIFYNGGDGNDVVLADATTPTIVYVDDAWASGGADPKNGGQTVADADLGVTGNQDAVFSINAFATVAEALAAVGTGGTIIVNDGIYNETIALNDSKKIEITGPNAPGAVTIDSLSSVAGTEIVLEGSSTLTIGDTASTTIAGLISGSGDLTKVGTGRLTVTGSNTYTGLTSIDEGIIRISQDTGLGTAAGGTTINQTNRGRLELTGGITVAEPITLTGAQQNVAGLDNVSGNNTLTGVLTVAGSTRIRSSSGIMDVAGGVANTANNQLVVNSTGGETHFTTNPINLNSGTFYADSGGTTVIGVAGNSWGNTTFSSGTLRLDVDNALPSNTSIRHSGLGYGSGGTIDLNGTTQEIAELYSANNNTSGLEATITNTHATNAASLTINQASDTTYFGSFNGDVALKKDGVGTLTLGGTFANTHTGLTTVSGGVLLLNKDVGVNAIAGDGNTATNDVLVENGAVLRNAAADQINDDVCVTLDYGVWNLDGNDEDVLCVLGTTAGAAELSELTLNGATLTLNRIDWDNASGTAVHPSITDGTGTLRFVADGATQAVFETAHNGNIYVNSDIQIDSASLTFRATTYANIIRGQVSGAGKVIFDPTSGAGGLTLENGANDYSGGTEYTSDSGTSGNWDLFTINASGALGSGDVTISGGNETTWTSSGAVPSGMIFRNGTTQANNFILSGDAVISVGNPNSATAGGDTVTLSGTFDLGGNDLFVRGTGIGTISGVVSGTGGITKNDNPGKWILTGTNTYDGATNVNAGVLIVNGDNSGATGAVTVANGADLGGTGTVGGIVTVVSGADLQPGDGGVGTLTINSNTIINGDLEFDVDGATNDLLTVAGDATAGDDVTLSGTVTFNTVADPTAALITVIDNDGTSDAVVGAFSNFVEGDSVTLGAKTYKIFYNGGDGNNVVLADATTPTVVYVDDAWATGGADPKNGGQIIADADFGTTGNQDAIFGINAFATIADALAAVGNNGTIIINDGDYSTEAITLADGKTIEITGPDTPGTVETVTIGSLSAGATESIIIEGDSNLSVGADGGSTDIASVISGSGSLTKAGTGTLTLSGANTHTGITTVAAGILKLNHATALGGSGSVATGTVVQNGGALDLNGFTQVGERIEINGPGTGAADTGALFNSAGSMNNNGVRFLTLGSDASIGSNGGRFGLNNGTVTGPGFTLTKVGSNDVWLSSNVSVANIVVNDGVYGAQGDAALNNVTGTVTVNAGAVLSTYANRTVTAAIVLNDARITGGTGPGSDVDVLFNGPITLTGTNTIDLPTFSDRDRAVIINGTISGPGSLVKSGDDDLTLTGANLYTGSTTVGAGTLIANNTSGSATGTGAVGVSSGGSLGGTGTIAGAVTVSSGGIIEPGDDTLDTLTIQGGVTQAGTWEVDVDGTGDGFADLLEITGDLSLAGTTLDVTTLVATDDNEYVIATYTGTRTGEVTIASIPDGYIVQYDDAGKRVVLAKPLATELGGLETGDADTGAGAPVTGTSVPNALDVISSTHDSGATGDTVPGVYGDLVVGPDGSVTYTLVDARVDSLDDGDQVEDTFYLGDTVVADYRDDFNNTTPATGWQYLWNAPADWDPGDQIGDYDPAGGPIGDSANYLAMLSAGSFWSSDGNTSGTDSNPDRFVRMTSTGGHPGAGANDPHSEVDRYAIAAYTVTEDGSYTVGDSFITRANTNFGDGGRVDIFVNNTLINSVIVEPGGTVDFDTALGDLVAGDTIYVASGTNGSAGSDGFTWDFSIQKATKLAFAVNGTNDVPIANDDSDVAIEAGGVANGTASVVASGNVIGDSFTVTNSSFEDVDLASGVIDSSAPAGWTVTGGAAGTEDRNSGVSSVYLSDTPDATDGEQYAYSNGGDLYQVVGGTLEPLTTYRLTVDVGEHEARGTGSPVIRLGTGSTFGSDLLTGTIISNTPAAAGGWSTFVTEFTTGENPVGLGDALRIELVNDGGTQVVFDNVRLTTAGVDTDVDAGDAPDDLNVVNITFNGTASDAVVDESLAVDGATTIDGAYGVLVINPDGSYTYTPTDSLTDSLAEGESVTETFTYAITDGVITGGTVASWDFINGTIQDWTSNVPPHFDSNGLGASTTENPTEHGASGAPRVIAIGSNAHDSIHETFLATSPEFTFDTATGTMLSVDFRGGDGSGSSQDNPGVVDQTFTSPEEVLAFNGGRSELNGQKGLALLNTVTGVYDAVIFPPRNNDTAGTEDFTLADLDGTNSRADVYANGNFDIANVYQLQFFDNDDGSWGWTKLATLDVAGTKVSSNADLTITVQGTNDAPVITDGPDTAALTETDASLTTSGTLTVTDVDTTDVVTGSVVLVASGDDPASPIRPTDAELLAMFTVNPAVPGQLLSGTETTKSLNWTFNSGAETFDYLAAGETLVLTYTVTATDDAVSPLSDSETVTITITGSNDGPEVSIAATNVNEGESTVVTGTLTDLDFNDTHTVTIGWDDANSSPNSIFNLPKTSEIDLGVQDTFTSSGVDSTTVLTITSVDTATGEISFTVEHRYLDDGVASSSFEHGEVCSPSISVNISALVDDPTTALLTDSEYATTLLAEGGNLTGYWRFDIATGALVDASGNGHTLTAEGDVMTGSTSAVLPFGEAANFDGDGDLFATGATATDLGFTGDFTASAWVYLDPNDPGALSGDNTIFGTDTSGVNNGMHLVIRDGRPHFGFFGNDTPGIQTLNTGEWYHIAFRYTVATGEQALFVNGELDRATTGHAAFAGGANEVKLGRWQNSNSRSFQGAMDEISVISRSLTNDEVLALATTNAASATITVTNVVPTLTLNNASVDEDGTAVMTGTITDPGLLDSHLLVVDWGDPNNIADATFDIGAVLSADVAAGTTSNNLAPGAILMSSTDDSELTITSTQAELDAGIIHYSLSRQILDDGLSATPFATGSNGTATDAFTVTMRLVDDDQASLESLLLADDDLNGFWRMEEAGGTAATATDDLVRDASGSNSHGTLTNGATASGTLVLDGVNDYLAIGTVGDLGINGSFTATATINLSSLVGDQTIFGTNRGGASMGLHLVIRAGKPHFGFFSNDTGSSMVLNTGQDYQVTFRYDAVAQTQTIFVDGVQIAQGTGKTSFVGPATDTVQIGKWTNGTEFSGEIDDAAILGRAMSDAEIAALQNCVAPPVMATATLTVTNQAPVLTLDPISGIDEAGIATVTGSASDVGALDSHQLVVDWGNPNDATNSVFELGAVLVVDSIDGNTSPNTLMEAGDEYTSTSGDGAVLTILTVAPDGSFTFSVTGHQYIDDDVVGTASDDYTVTVTITDDDLGVDSDTEAITVSNVNPDPEPDFYGTTEADVLIISSPADGVLGNDNDVANPNGPLTAPLHDPLQVISIDTSATKGTVSMNPDGTFSYDPNGQFEYLGLGVTATDTFVYTVSDNDGGTATETVTITVTGLNDVPTAVEDVVTVFEGGQGGSETVAGNALANDTDPDITGTPDDDVLSVVNVEFDGTPFSGATNSGGTVSSSGTSVDGLYGTLSINSKGEFVYTVDGNLPTTRALDTGDVGIEIFTYLISDGNGGFSEEQIVVRVVGKTGGKIGEFFGVGGSGILEGFRFAEPRDHGGGGEGGPLLLLMPTYSGTAMPGSVITLTVMGADGSVLAGGSMTVVADLSGGWIAKFSGLEIGNTSYLVKVETAAPAWSTGVNGTFEVFFAPAINGSHTETSVLTVDSVMGRRLGAVALDDIIGANAHPNGSNADWRKANGMP